MNTYLGVRRIQAEPCDLKGIPGYKVIYANGFEGWVKKDDFEREYFQIERPDKLCPDDIDRFVAYSGYQNIGVSGKSTLIRAAMISGFQEYEVSSCIDPKNYSAQIGYENGMKHVKDRLWKMLGFVLQWADHGLENKEQHSDIA